MRGSNQKKASLNSWGKGLQWMYVVCTWVFWPFVNNENLDFFLATSMVWNFTSFLMSDSVVHCYLLTFDWPTFLLG